MSIFEHLDIDSVLLTYLSIDDLKALSLVSRYYCDLTNDILRPFRKFFATRNDIKFINQRLYYPTFRTRFDDITKCDNKTIMFIQACINNNLDIVKYVYHTFKPDIFNRTISLWQDFMDIDFAAEEVYMIYRLMLEMCIIRRQNQLIEWLIDINKKRAAPKLNILLNYIPKDIISDKYYDLLKEADITFARDYERIDDL